VQEEQERVFREAEAKCVILLEDRHTRLCATLMRVSDVDVYPRLSLSLCVFLCVLRGGRRLEGERKRQEETDRRRRAHEEEVLKQRAVLDAKVRGIPHTKERQRMYV
jgi:hypothetical protein